MSQQRLVFILKNIRQRLYIVRQRVYLISRLRLVDQIEQINIILPLELNLVFHQVIEQLFGLLVQQLVEAMRLHQMRIGLHADSAQILLHMKYITAHLGNAMRADLLKILDRPYEYRRNHETQRIEHIIHFTLLQRPKFINVKFRTILF